MYRITGIGTSLVLIAAGAVLAWAVTADAEGVDLNTVGIILFIVGIIGLAISLLAGMAARTDHQTVVDRDNRTYVERPPTETVIERERR